MNLEREYVERALTSVEPWLYLLPTDVQRALRLAKSVMDTHGCALIDELRVDLGDNWVIAKRTKRIVEKYGEDVNAISQKKYEAAERAAIERRVP